MGKQHVISPLFQNLRSLKIDDYEIARAVIGEGPVRGSERIQLASDDEQEVVRITSPLEEFPADAIEEIRQERMAGDTDFSLPPCRVEIVVGGPGEQRLYVVLPTDKQTRLPFSVNAPFVQDPARMGIKDPSISPTNRWLLERVGRLATESMQDWLSQERCDQTERAEAYCLLPDHRIDSGVVIDASAPSLRGILWITRSSLHPTVLLSHSALCLPIHSMTSGTPTR